MRLSPKILSYFFNVKHFVLFCFCNKLFIQGNYYKFANSIGCYCDEQHVDEGGIDSDQAGTRKSAWWKYNPQRFQLKYIIVVFEVEFSNCTNYCYFQLEIGRGSDLQEMEAIHPPKNPKGSSFMTEDAVAEIKLQLAEEKNRRLDLEKDLELQSSMRAETEVALKLLEKDIHDKQDTIVSLRKQLEDIKIINLEMYRKMQVSDWLSVHLSLFYTRTF